MLSSLAADLVGSGFGVFSGSVRCFFLPGDLAGVDFGLEPGFFFVDLGLGVAEGVF